MSVSAVEPVGSAPTTELRLADIARMAGVSAATASRALNNSYGVSEKTRERVQQVALDNGFVASPEAVRLARGSLGRVALVVPHMSRWFFGAMVEGIDAVLRDADIDLLLYHVGSLEDRRDFFEKLPARRKVDAVIVVAFPIEDAERERLELLKVHIVAAGGQHAVYPSVHIDDRHAAILATGHLIELGHRRIGMIEATDVDQPTEPTGRSRGYYDALKDAGLDVDRSLVVSSPWSVEAGGRALDALMDLETPPTAIYAHSDEVAAGAMRQARRRGLRVPEDVSIIGIDDHPIADILDLTTVRQDVFEQGRRAAVMTLDLMQGRAQGNLQETVPTSLVVRRSTARPASPF